MYYEDILRLIELFKRHPLEAVAGLVLFVGLLVFLAYLDREKR